MKLHLLSVIGLHFDFDYLVHHTAYYQDKVDKMHYIFNLPEKDEELLSKARELLNDVDNDISTYLWEGQFNTQDKIDRQNDVIESIDDKDWLIVPDVDEFHYYFGLSFREVIREHGKEHQTIFAEFIDRVSKSGKPLPLKKSPSIWLQFPNKEERTKGLDDAVTKRVSLMSAKRRLKTPHVSDEIRHDEYTGIVGDIHHFKWVSSTKEKLEQRVKDFKEIGLSWWKESEIALEKFYKD